MQLQEKSALTNLLEEMIQADAPVHQAPSAEGSSFSHLFKNEGSKKRHLSLFPLFLSITFLGGLGLGVAFGFYWGQSQTIPYAPPSLSTSPSEIIQPLAPPHDHIV